MSCQHARKEEEGSGLPCPWPGCPDGTPQDAVAVMSGEAGVLRVQKPYRVEIEAEEGVAMFRRRPVGDAWEWEQITS